MMDDVQRGYARNPIKTDREDPTKPRKLGNKTQPVNDIVPRVVSHPVWANRTSGLPLIIAGVVVGFVLLVLVLSSLASRQASGPEDNGVPIQGASFIYPAGASKVYYTVDNLDALTSSIYVREGDSEAVLVTTVDSLVSQIAVSSDDKYLAFAAGKDESGFPQPTLHVMNLDTRRTSVETSPDDGNVVDMTFAQDGAVLFTLEKGESSDILQLDIESGKKYTILSNGSRNADPVLVDSSLYFIDKSNARTVKKLDTQTHNTAALALSNITLIQVMGQQLFYVDDKGNIHTTQLVGDSLSGDTIVFDNKDSYTVVRLFAIENGCRALITKGGTYELTGELR
jgi:WD40 repeat protein